MDDTQSNTILDYSVVIPTTGRADVLEVTLNSLAAQDWLPRRVIVVDASEGSEIVKMCNERQSQFSVKHLRATKRSAAMQRNEGAVSVETPLVAFSDDDMRYEPAAFAKLCGVWKKE